MGTKTASLRWDEPMTPSLPRRSEGKRLTDTDVVVPAPPARASRPAPLGLGSPDVRAKTAARPTGPSPPRRPPRCPARGRRLTGAVVVTEAGVGCRPPPAVVVPAPVTDPAPFSPGGVKLFSYSSSAAGLGLLPYIFVRTGAGTGGVPLKVALAVLAGVFTLATPVLLHLVTKGYVLRLYHAAETDTYTAVTYGALLAEKRTVFRRSDVRVPELHHLFTTFYAETRSMLVDPALFPLARDYDHLMGYDKPLALDGERGAGGDP